MMRFNPFKPFLLTQGGLVRAVTHAEINNKYIILNHNLYYIISNCGLSATPVTFYVLMLRLFVLKYVTVAHV